MLTSKIRPYRSTNGSDATKFGCTGDETTPIITFDQQENSANILQGFTFTDCVQNLSATLALYIYGGESSSGFDFCINLSSVLHF